MAEQKKYVDSVALKHLLEKLRDKNAALFLGKTAEAASAAKVKNALTLTVGDTDVVFDGSEAKSTAVAAKDHTHATKDINDFDAAVKKVISDAGGTSHAHDNKGVLDTISADRVAGWDAKIAVGDVEKIVYTNNGVGGTTNVKNALDILVANVQIAAGTLTQTTKNIDAVKKIADDAAAAVVAEKTRAEGKEGELKTAIDAMNNVNTGILKQAKDYADGKDAAIATAKKAGDDAQKDVNALKGKVGEVPADKTVVQMIADAQTNATYDDTALTKRVKDIEDDYLKAADKTELQGNIDTVSGVANAAKEKIDTFMLAADVKEGAVDTLKEIQDYITSDGAAAQKMTQDIAANAQAIKDEADRAKAAEKVNADAIAVLNGADTVESSVAKAVKDAKDAVMTEVNKKVAQTDYDTKVAALEKADTDNLAAAKKYADDQDAEIEAILGHKAIDGGEGATGLCADVAANAAAIAAETTARQDADKLLSDRIAKFEGNGAGSVAAQVKAVADDLKAHKEAQVVKEKAVDDKLAVIQGEANVEGSIKKALADAKKYTDDQIDAMALTAEEINSMLNTVYGTQA